MEKFSAMALRIRAGKMCVVQNVSGLDPEPIRSPDQLQEQDEIRLQWGSAYQDWHQQNWNTQLRPFVETDSMVLLRRYIQKPGLWGLMPQIELNCFQHEDLRLCDLGEHAPPERSIYLVASEYIHQNRRKAARLFLKSLRAFVHENRELLTLYESGFPN